MHAYSRQNHDENRNMAAIGQELCQLMAQSGGEKGKLTRVLDELRAAILLHFGREEALMREENYPNYFHHRRSHAYIITEMSVFISSYAAGRTDTVNDIWPHLNKTLDTHMGKYDADLTTYLSRTDR
ncbi:MAG: hemerythrin family protein [Rhodospirillaceae bacterium]